MEAIGETPPFPSANRSVGSGGASGSHRVSGGRCASSVRTGWLICVAHVVQRKENQLTAVFFLDEVDTKF